MNDTKPSILVLPPTDFKLGYDYNFTQFLTLDYKKQQYIPWSAALVMLRELFPTITEYSHELEVYKDGEGNITGVTIHHQFIDVTTGSISPKYSYPVMNKDGQRSGATSLDARLINDNMQRAFVRAIAQLTGIGLRLWTREGMDVTKKCDSKHPKFLYLTRIANLEAAYADRYGLPDDYIKPNFSMLLTQFDSYKFLSQEPVKPEAVTPQAIKEAG